MQNTALPASIATPAIALPSDYIRLDWIPIGPPRLRPPVGLSAHERGWWINLFFAMFDADPQGYLAVTSDIWSVAGAHDRQRWESQCARVMASFNVADIAGRHVIFFPALIEVLETQREKVRNHRRRGGIPKSKMSEGGEDLHTSHSVQQADGPLSLSLQSDFAFDFEEATQIQKQSTTRARTPAREARAAAAYTEADFDARDLRKMAKAWEQLAVRDSMGRAAGSDMTNRQMFEQVCLVAGVSISRGLELEERRKKWPEKVPDWLRERPAIETETPAAAGPVWSLSERRASNKAEQRTIDNLRVNAQCKQRLRERFGPEKASGSIKEQTG